MDITKVEGLSEIIDDIIDFFQHFANVVKRLIASIHMDRGWDGEVYDVAISENEALFD